MQWNEVLKALKKLENWKKQLWLKIMWTNY